MRCKLLVSIAVLLTTTPALAQNAFTGARLEGVIGYDSADIGGENNAGVLYGAAVGYDLKAGGAVVGAEAELTVSQADECTANYAGSGGTLCTELDRDLYLGARVGTQVGSAVLLYAKAGYTNVHLQTSYSTGVIGAGSDESRNISGLRLGAGGEFALGPNSYLKTEYRYSNYGQGFDTVGTSPVGGAVILSGDRHHRHQLVAGFGFRF